MYVIKLKGRKVSVDGQRLFSNYEEARYALRRKIRRMVAKGVASRGDFYGTQGWDGISRNPANFTDYGFNIVNVLS